MLYLDANVFVFVALNTETEGAKAVAFLSKIQSGGEKAVTAALTFDEVFSEAKRNRGLDMALDTADSMLNFPNLEIASANRETAMADWIDTEIWFGSQRCPPWSNSYRTKS